MEAQRFATPSPVCCRPFSWSRARLLPRHASAFQPGRLPRPFVCRNVANGPLELPEAHSFASFLSDERVIEPRATSISASCHEFNLLRWLASLLYRALLMAGIGLSLGQIAAVHAAPIPSVSAVLTKDASNGKQKAEGKALQGAKPKEASSVLGDEFWRGLNLARASDEFILKQVLDRNPSNVSALECLAKTLMDVDNFPHALLVLEKLEGLQPDQLEWKFMRAEAYDLHGNPEFAKKTFEEILKADPYSSRALQGLVLAMDQLGQSDSALKILEDTWNKAKQENYHIEARNFGMLIGQVHMFKGRMQEALQHYNNMIEEDPNDFRPFLSQGIIYCVTGDVEKADESFQAFERLCPEDLQSKEVLDGLKERARKEGQKIYESKQRKKAKAGQKGEKKKK